MNYCRKGWRRVELFRPANKETIYSLDRIDQSGNNKGARIVSDKGTS